MFEFVRPSPWLRHLFTPSRSQQPNPTAVSREVSLTQPYDGGGFPLFDPASWVISVQSVVSASVSTVIRLVPADTIMRVLAITARLDAGVAPLAHAQSLIVPGFSVALGADVLLTNQLANIPCAAPIIGPGHTLRGHYHTGGAATQVTWTAYIVEVPIGTVFYL